MTFNKIADKVTCDIRAIFSFSVIYFLAIDLQSRIRIASIMSFSVHTLAPMLPQAGLIETKVPRRV